MLSDHEADVLRFEKANPRFDGRKESLIAEHWGWTPARYSMVLHELMNRPESMTHNSGEFAPFINQFMERSRMKREARTPKKA